MHICQQLCVHYKIKPQCIKQTYTLGRVGCIVKFSITLVASLSERIWGYILFSCRMSLSTSSVSNLWSALRNRLSSSSWSWKLSAECKQKVPLEECFVHNDPHCAFHRYIRGQRAKSTEITRYVSYLPRLQIAADCQQNYALKVAKCCGTLHYRNEIHGLFRFSRRNNCKYSGSKRRIVAARKLEETTLGQGMQGCMEKVKKLGIVELLRIAKQSSTSNKSVKCYSMWKTQHVFKN